MYKPVYQGSKTDTIAVTYDAWNPDCSSSVLITASSGRFCASYSSRILSACSAHSSLVLVRVLGLRVGGITGFSNARDDEDPDVIVKAASGSDSYGLGRSGRPPAEDWAMLRDAAAQWPGGSSVTANYRSVSVRTR